MGYRFKRMESLADGVRRIADEEIGRALDELADPNLERHAAVHQVRKRCKKLRGLIRLARGGALADGAYRRENARYRDAARRLSALRDAEVLVHTYDAVMDDFRGTVDRRQFGPVRGALTRRRKGIAGNDTGFGTRVAQLEATLTAGRKRLEDLEFDADGFEGFAPGLAKTYGRARRAMAAARDDGSDELLHEWRKRVKYHWYHTRLMQGCWSGPMQARRRELKNLADLLGDDHDLAVLRQTLHREGNLIGDAETGLALLGLIAARRTVLQQKAFLLGRRLFAEKTKRHVARVRAYWRVWRDVSARGGLAEPVGRAA